MSGKKIDWIEQGGSIFGVIEGREAALFVIEPFTVGFGQGEANGYALYKFGDFDGGATRKFITNSATSEDLQLQAEQLEAP